MAFTLGNDVNILQSTDTSVIGAGAGNDTYILSPFTLTGFENITITDTQGINSLQLVGGLQIASSRVASGAMQLTLTNGSVITVLGNSNSDISNFTFEAGGNIAVGINNPDVSFAAFVQNTLNTKVPIGGDINSGGPVTVSGSAATISLAGPTDPSVNEGQTTVFTLTGSQPGVSYGYILSGVQAADVEGGQLSGTVTIGKAGTVQIPVTLVADRITEGSELVTVTVADLTSSVTINDTSTDPFLSANQPSVNEGGAAIFTLQGGWPGASYNYQISGVSAADIVGGQLTGTITIGQNGVGQVSVQLVADRLTEGAETLTLTVPSYNSFPQTVSVTVHDTSTNMTLSNVGIDANVPTKSVFWGSTQTFYLAHAEPGAHYYYNYIFSAVNLNPSVFSGMVTVDNSGIAQIPIALNYGFGLGTLTVTVADLTSSVTVNNTPLTLPPTSSMAVSDVAQAPTVLVGIPPNAEADGLGVVNLA